MRIATTGAVRATRATLVALGLVALTAAGASAQLIFDGNIMYGNRITIADNSETLADQFLTVTAPPGACPVGYSTIVLGTTTFTHNSYANPILPNAVYQTNAVPDFRPGAGSPAASHSVVVPADGFFDQTCYAGAIDPAGPDWTQGWTYYDSTGADRQDLHLPGMPDPRPLATYNNVSIYSPHQYFRGDSNYRVIGQLRVKSGGVLTVAPGTVIFQDRATVGTIIVERGGRLHAVGTDCDPIIITSGQDPGSQSHGDCGGLYLLGYGRMNPVNTCAGDSVAAEGGTVGYFGGNDDNDGSGQLRYVRVEFAGRERSPNNELNSFTFCGVGRNTQMEYCQAYMGDDDSFEWFGGTMDSKYLVAIDGRDDGYDTQLGARTRAQYVIVRTSPFRSMAGTQWGDKAIEADNTETSPYDQTVCAGRSFNQLANCTFIGDQRLDVPPATDFPGPLYGVHWRRGVSYTLLNSIIAYYKTGALGVEHDATWNAHCAAIPADRTSFCTPTQVSVTPMAEGSVLVAHSAPNPFRNRVNLSFALPQGGPVSVEIYAADGRRVQTLAEGELPAGQHTVTWNIDRATPVGMYFYKVLAGNQRATGKITRID